MNQDNNQDNAARFLAFFKRERELDLMEARSIARWWAEDVRPRLALSTATPIMLACVEEMRDREEHRRDQWWAEEVAPQLPAGARPAGWDSLLVATPEDEAAARALFAARPNTVVVRMDPGHASELGVLNLASMWAPEDPEGEEEYPMAVVGWRWTV